MQIAIHAAAQKANYQPLSQEVTGLINNLQIAGNDQAVKNFNNVFEYHTQVIQHLAGLKAAAEVSQKEKPVFQEEFICLSMQTINEYSRLLIAAARRIASAGLKNHSNMILTGSSLFLGGNEDGSFFQIAATVTAQKFGNRKMFFRLSTHTERKGDHGIYTAFIQELLDKLSSFCHDHFLYKEILAALKKTD